ncbi:MAG: glycogen/starch synthase [Spirochaetales bacterium]
MRRIWLLSREMEGWAEAGGIKDVVRDQAVAFARLGWETNVVLPLYGFLRPKVFAQAALLWRGSSQHPAFDENPIEVWTLHQAEMTLHFVRIPSFEDKDGIYTYSSEDADPQAGKVKGTGYLDTFKMNLEYQWAITDYWFANQIEPQFVLGHDGHAAFLPAIARTHPAYRGHFLSTKFSVLIHNAGLGYRQEMPDSPFHRELLHLPLPVQKQCLLESWLDPMVSASHHASLATVSVNYALELTSGKNDHWSGTFGRFLRENRVPLKGINNGIGMDDKDPRKQLQPGFPPFDPSTGDWKGKTLCRSLLRERILLTPSLIHGRISNWNKTLYMNQGRLTGQKGIAALCDLIEKALTEQPDAIFIVMAQGERKFEERLLWLARNHIEKGRMLFINKYEDGMARLLFAAADFLVIPSEYEPCGLTDLKAQLMGTLPIVHRVGGLVKVLDGVTGFSYSRHTRPGLWGVFLKTLELQRSNRTQLDHMRRTAFASVLENSQWTRILEEHYIPWLTQSPAFPIVAQ